MRELPLFQKKIYHIVKCPKVGVSFMFNQMAV